MSSAIASPSSVELRESGKWHISVPGKTVEEKAVVIREIFREEVKKLQAALEKYKKISPPLTEEELAAQLEAILKLSANPAVTADGSGKTTLVWNLIRAHQTKTADKTEWYLQIWDSVNNKWTFIALVGVGAAWYFKDSLPDWLRIRLEEQGPPGGAPFPRSRL